MPTLEYIITVLGTFQPSESLFTALNVLYPSWVALILVESPSVCCYLLFNPVQVARHLAKLFDSMAKLKFKEDDGGQPTKEALGMYSKDGEYVNFAEPCKCVGQVESWLNTLLDTMQATIRHEFMEAIVTYEEKPRDKWIFDPPAQVRFTVQ